MVAPDVAGGCASSGFGYFGGAGAGSSRSPRSRGPTLRLLAEGAGHHRPDMTLPQIPPKLADLAAMRGTTTEAVSRTLTLAPPAGVENFDALRAIADDEHTGIARTGDRSG